MQYTDDKLSEILMYSNVPEIRKGNTRKKWEDEFLLTAGLLEARCMGLKTLETFQRNL